MNCSSKEIEDHIAEAEKKSAITCEVCGKEGELRNRNGWFSTTCDEHTRK